MKFAIGSETDSAHCAALKHEFLRREDAFKEFEKYGTAMIMRAREADNGPTTNDESRRVAFKTYNDFARLVHHPYEFLVGALARERGSTEKIRADDADRWIHAKFPSGRLAGSQS